MSSFVSPAELMKWHDENAALLSSAAYIRSPQHQRLKEVWCAARFGIGYERHVRRPCLLHVSDVQSSDTDFIFRVDGNEFPFQTTIADAPERKMVDDYRPTKDGSPHLMPYEAERHRLESPSWIELAIDRKIAKHYAGAASLNLLVYANLSTALRDYDAIRNAVRKDQQIFNSVWVMTNYQLCSVYSTGKLGSIAMLAVISDLEI
jgi:hypothetical protein